MVCNKRFQSRTDKRVYLYIKLGGLDKLQQGRVTSDGGCSPLDDMAKKKSSVLRTLFKNIFRAEWTIAKQ